MNAEISELHPDDLGELLKLERSSFSDPWTEYMFKDALESPFQTVYKLTEDGNLVGYVCIHVFDADGEILSLAVSPEKRRLGYGGKLLGFALGIMKNAGVATVFLEVRKSNIPAASLYLASGFSPVGVRKNYYRRPTEDAIVMRKDLN